MPVMETLKDKAETMASSAGEMNKFTIDKVEEIARMNLASASYFSEIAIRQMRAMSGIRDLESMRKFTADTISLSGEMTKKMLDDSKAWMSFGSDVKEKVSDVFSKKDEVKDEAKGEAEVKKRIVTATKPV